MRRLWLAAITLGTATGTIAADQFDGSKPMVCLPTQGHDCLPTEQSCTPLQPEKGKDLRMYFDLQGRTARTPYRNEMLTLRFVESNTASLVMQGTSLQLVWSATIHRSTGRMTLAIADREGAYVVFGQCTLADTAPPKN